MFRKNSFGFLFCAMVGGTGSAFATTINLTTAGSSGTGAAALGGTFQVQQIAPQSTGTGVIDSFLRVHSNRTDEQGYNTTPNNLLDNVNGNFTRPLLLSEVPIVQLADGFFYRQFLLDVNQTGSDSLISLNQVQIFQAPTDQQATNTPLASSPIVAFAAPAVQVFRLSDFGPQTWEIVLDYSLNHGSGSGDMFLYVRNSLFNASVSNVLFYTQFGTQPGLNNQNDGFEEWAVLKGTIQECVGDCTINATPEPASLLLLGTGLGLVAIRMRRKKTSK